MLFVQSHGRMPLDVNTRARTFKGDQSASVTYN